MAIYKDVEPLEVFVWKSENEDFDKGVKFALEKLDTLPTADVVEVTRCKDCDVPHNKWLGCPHLNGLIPPPDFYCAKGTPKERGGET